MCSPSCFKDIGIRKVELGKKGSIFVPQKSVVISALIRINIKFTLKYIFQFVKAFMVDEMFNYQLKLFY